MSSSASIGSKLIDLKSERNFTSNINIDSYCRNDIFNIGMIFLLIQASYGIVEAKIVIEVFLMS